MDRTIDKATVYIYQMMISKLTSKLQYPSAATISFSWLVGELLGKYQFGTNCNIHPFCLLENPEAITVGDQTYLKNHTVIKAKQPNGINIGNNCSVNEFAFLSGNITIGDGVRIADHASMHSYNHMTDMEEMVYNQPLDHGQIEVEDDVWIGAGARVLKDVRIGEGAVVGAGAVVTSDVNSYEIVGGNPAKKIGER